MTIINFQNLIQHNTKEELSAALVELDKAIEREPNTYTLRQQRKQFDVALAWEAPTISQKEQFALISLQNAKRQMKQIKVELKKKRARKYAETQRQKQGVVHCLFPEIFMSTDGRFDFARTGCSDLDSSFKNIYGKECPEGFHRKRGCTVYREIVEFLNETHRQEYLTQHPRAITAVGRVDTQSLIADLIKEKVTETSRIKGFRAKLKSLYKIKASRTAMGYPDSQLPAMYTTMRRNWK